MMRSKLKYHVLLAGFGLLLLSGSCSMSPTKTELMAENTQLKKEIAERDSVISRVGFGSKILQHNLDDLNELERDLRLDLISQAEDSVIESKVMNITALVAVNRGIIEDLKSGVGKPNLPVQLMMNIVAKLDDRVTDGEDKVIALANDIGLLEHKLCAAMRDYPVIASRCAEKHPEVNEYASGVRGEDQKPDAARHAASTMERGAGAVALRKRRKPIII